MCSLMLAAVLTSRHGMSAALPNRRGSWRVCATFVVLRYAGYHAPWPGQLRPTDDRSWYGPRAGPGSDGGTALDRAVLVLRGI